MHEAEGLFLAGKMVVERPSGEAAIVGDFTHGHLLIAALEKALRRLSASVSRNAMGGLVLLVLGQFLRVVPPAERNLFPVPKR